MTINEQELTFNIPYDMHEEDWLDLIEVYKSLPSWLGMEHDGSSYWFGKEEDNIYIKARITFVGLVIEGNMPDPLWARWILEFIEKSSEALGFEVKSIYHK